MDNAAIAAKLMELAALVNPPAPAPTPVTTPPPATTPAPTLPAAGRRVLTAADLTYAGRMLLPLDPNPATRYAMPWPTSGYGGLAVRRRPDGKKSIFVVGATTTADPALAGNPVLEISLDGYSLDAAKPVRGALLNHWNPDQFYGASRVVPAEDRMPETRGLLWDGATNSLLWTFSGAYAVAGGNRPFLGVTAFLADGTLQVFGPWLSTLDHHQTAGYLILGKNGKLYCGDGLRAGDAQSSFGPCLNQLEWPHLTLPLTTILTATPLVFFPNNLPLQNQPPHLLADGTPNTNWVQGDNIYAAAWVDMPTVQGVMFFGQVAGGHIWYDTSGVVVPWVDPFNMDHGYHAETRTPTIWVISADDLAAVNAGQKKPWEIVETSRIDPNVVAGQVIIPPGRIPTGAYFDAEENCIYFIVPQTEQTGPYNWQPTLHRFNVRA